MFLFAASAWCLRRMSLFFGTSLTPTLSTNFLLRDTSVWFNRKVPETTHSFHQPATVRAGKSVQTQQVPITTQTLRSGHFSHADRDTGEEKATRDDSACFTAEDQLLVPQRTFVNSS